LEVYVLTPGNRKLGAGRLVWGFGLPSRFTCPGRTPACEGPCYSARLEACRPSLRRRYERNLQLSLRSDFAQLVLACLTLHDIRVVRIHIGGDYYSAAYARKWLAVMRQASQVRFFFYTRSWRVPAIRRVLWRMARLPNVRAWLSCDRDTGVPARVPPGVRLAWLMTSPDDLPPRADLVFRTLPLRRTVRKRVGLALVCPVENGATGHKTDCERCGVCWR
jgi:hypothetical protein